jgi:peptide-methionine (R)-S-oxide reductase
VIDTRAKMTGSVKARPEPGQRFRRNVGVLSRRRILTGTVALAAVGLGGRSLLAGSGASGSAGAFEVVKTADEWRRILTEAEFHVLREHGTERPGSSPLNEEKRAGTFTCAGCDLPLFSSETKYESGTGWPSFWAPLEGAIGTSEDRSWLMVRTEAHCRRCGGHLGHVFPDGPPPTGLRYCMNGVALAFVPAASG